MITQPTQALRVPSSPQAGPACPDCGTARRVVIDGLTGTTKTVCDECPRRADLARRQQAFDVAAFARVAQLHGLTVDDLREKLQKLAPIGQRKRCLRCGAPCARKYCAMHKVLVLPVTCRECGAEIPKGQHGRSARLCALHRPRATFAATSIRKWGFCQECDVPLDYVRGHGRPPLYCDEHRPATLTKKYADREDRVARVACA